MGSAFDRWLEKPYLDHARTEQEFEEFCEEFDVEFDAPDAWERFQAYKDSFDEVGYDPDEERDRLIDQAEEDRYEDHDPYG